LGRGGQWPVGERRKHGEEEERKISKKTRHHQDKKIAGGIHDREYGMMLRSQ